MKRNSHKNKNNPYKIYSISQQGSQKQVEVIYLTQLTVNKIHIIFFIGWEAVQVAKLIRQVEAHEHVEFH